MIIQNKFSYIYEIYMKLQSSFLVFCYCKNGCISLCGVFIKSRNFWLSLQFRNCLNQNFALELTPSFSEPNVMKPSYRIPRTRVQPNKFCFPFTPKFNTAAFSSLPVGFCKWVKVVNPLKIHNRNFQKSFVAKSESSNRLSTHVFVHGFKLLGPFRIEHGGLYSCRFIAK